MSTKQSARQKQLLRWVLILPGAVAGGAIAIFPIHWMLVFWIFPHDGKFFLDFIEFPKQLDVDGIELALTPFVLVVFSIWAGAEIAPKYKIAVGCLLSGVWLIAGAYAFLSSDGQAPLEIKTVGGVLGLFVGPVIVWLRARRASSTIASQEEV